MSAADGGAAFPSPGVVVPGDFGRMQQQGAYEGMTLRDYFATHCRPVLDEDESTVSVFGVTTVMGSELPKRLKGEEAQAYWLRQLQWNLEGEAKLRYMFADAMLKARAG